MTTTEVLKLLGGARCAELQHGIDVFAIDQPRDVAIRDMAWGPREIAQARVYMDHLRVARRGLKSFRATVYLNANEAILPNANMVVDIDAMDGVLGVTVDDIAAGVQPGIPAGVSSDIHIAP